MARVHFTPHLAKHVDCPSCDVPPGTLREVLDRIFLERPALSGYILDDQKRLRQHVMIFIDNAVIRDRQHLSDSVHHDSQVFVMQALSGG